MKLLFRVATIVLLLSATVGTNKVQASHISGANIWWECLGGGNYRVYLELYRDCAGISMGSETVFFNSTCGNSFSVVMPVPLPVEVSQLCPTALATSTCNGGTLPGMQVYIYSAIVAMPPCALWTMSWSTCCRNTGVITNISVGAGVYTQATMNNVIAPCNNSPQFQSFNPLPYVCLNQPVKYNFDVIDPEGDSLAYSFAPAFTGAAAWVTYQAPWSGAQPITGININPATGLVTFTPNATGSFVVCVRVDEFDWSGNWIGTTYRDIQFVVINCVNQMVTCPAGVNNMTGNSVQTGAFQVEMCAGNNFCFEISFSDPDPADIVTVTTTALSVLPGATFAVVGTNPAIATICWTALPGSPEYVSFTVSGEDNSCPVMGFVSSTVLVHVVPSTYAGPDQIICGAQAAQLTAVGGSLFNWTLLSTGLPPPPGEFSCNPCSNPIATPLATETYVVNSNLAGTCIAEDTVTINVVPDYNNTLTQSKTTACLQGEVDFQVTSAPLGGYTYSWTNAAWFNNPASPTPTGTMMAPGLATLYLKTTSPFGCVKRDSVKVNVSSNLQPMASVVPSTIITCPGVDSVPLLATNLNAIPPDCNSYDTEAIPFAPVPGAGTGVVLGDDQVTAALPIGFSFEFFCNVYTNFYISSNGFITFNPGAANGCCSGQSLPNALTPDNLVALGWEDLNPSQGGTIEYFTTGTAPNRKLVVNFTNIPHYFNQDPITIQAILYETSNFVEVHTTTVVNGPGELMTQGIENVGGTIGYAVPGRNSTAWNATNDAFRFLPQTQPDPTLFVWSPPTFLSNTNTADPVIGYPTGPMNYTVYLIDTVGGCSDSTDVSLIFGGWTTTQPIINAIPANCGVTDGKIIITPNGGISPYQFSINNGATWNAFNIFPGLATGDYDVSILDGAGCRYDETVNVSHPNLPVFNAITPTNPLCNGDMNGQLVVAASGGTLPFQYSPNGVLYGGSNILSGLPAGNFTVYLKDAMGCVITQAASLTDPALLQITGVTPTAALCKDDCNGRVLINATGGTGALQYSINGGTNFVPGANFTNLCADPLMNIVVRDANGCIANTTTSVTEPPLLSMTFNKSNVICNAACNGTASVLPVGGTGTMTYQWDGVTSTANSKTGLCAGSHYLQVRDANQCMIDTTYMITEPLPVSISNITVEDATCFGSNDGSILVSGTNAVKYSIAGAGALGPNNFFTNLAPGNYTVMVEGAVNNCRAQQVVTIGQPDQLILTPSSDAEICQNGSTLLSVTAAGGNNPGSPSLNTYVWTENGVPSLQVPSGQGESGPHSVTLTADQTFTVAAFDTKGCNADPVSIFVNVHPGLTINLPDTVKMCPGESVRVEVLSAFGGSGKGYTYEWFNGNGWSIPSTTGNAYIFAPEISGYISVRLHDDCETSPIEDQTYVVVHPSMTVDFSVTDADGCHPFETVFTNTSTPAYLTGDECVWDFGDLKESNDCAPEVSHVFTDEGDFDVILRVKTIDGCWFELEQEDMITVYDVPVASFATGPTPFENDPTVKFFNYTSGDCEISYEWWFGEEGELGKSTMREPTFIYPTLGDKSKKSKKSQASKDDDSNDDGNGVIYFPTTLIASNTCGCSDTVTSSIPINPLFRFFAPNAFTPDSDGDNDVFAVYGQAHKLQNYELQIYDRWGKLQWQSQNRYDSWDGVSKYGQKAPPGVYVWKVSIWDANTSERNEFAGYVTLVR